MVDVEQQVWAGVLSRAPDGQAIQATYQHTSTRGFQLAVGACVLAAARSVPDGLLVFTPSYSLLDKLCAAWKVCHKCACSWLWAPVCWLLLAPAGQPPGSPRPATSCWTSCAPLGRCSLSSGALCTAGAAAVSSVLMVSLPSVPDGLLVCTSRTTLLDKRHSTQCEPLPKL